MPSYILVVADPDTGQTHQYEYDDADLAGQTLGDTIDGAEIGLPGYELELTGGSDAAGRPMRQDVEGRQTKEILSAGGTGFRPTRKGERKRITVRGSEIGSETTQLNFKIVSAGEQSLEELIDGE